jgi:hypothetical protein
MYTHEYALLAVVAIPFLAVVGLNVYLWWEGESGTLLMPSSGKLPTVLTAREAVEDDQPIDYEVAPISTILQPVCEAVASNDVHEREAA